MFITRKKMRLNSSRACASVFAVVSLLGVCHQSYAGNTLRIVDWNIEDDINGATTPRAGFNTVLEGMGNEIIAGVAQPIDVMALEETTSNAITVQPVLNMLNGDYAGANYQMSSYQATEEGGDNTDGNGPNAIVYNANTVSLLASVGVGTPTGSSNGEYRQVVRYEFQPVGGSSPFYVYVSHMKSGSGSPDNTYRGEEATLIRANEATLPANSSIIVTGDLNADPTESGETQFSIFGAAGAGQVTDPLGYPSGSKYYTESATNLRYRDDYQLISPNVQNDTAALNYVSGTLESFGENGTGGSNVSSGSNTDLAYMTAAAGYSPTQSQILSALTTASDHLPNVADYTFPVPEPTSLTLIIGGACGLLVRRSRFRGKVFLAAE
jgi:hypothetical protein